MRDGLPTTCEEVLRHWLSYRYPHFDAMEARAATTLTGTCSAVVRAGWNGDVGSANAWHLTLFTLAAETPDAGRTRTAAETMKPAGMLMHHIVSPEQHPDAKTPDSLRIAHTAGAVHDACLAASRATAVARDPLTPVEGRRRTAEAADAAAATARTAVEEAITVGLRARIGFLLVPTMIVKPAALADCLAYQALLALRSRLDSEQVRGGSWRPEGVAVCRGCSAVFVPRRRRTGEFCPLCSKRPAVPEVLGQRSLAPFETATVRAPNLVGNLIVGWRSATVGLCPECGGPFIGRRDSATCPACSARVRQRRRRAR